MPHEKVVYDVTAEKKICSRCGENLTPLGESLIRTEIQFILAKLKVIDFYQKTYQCEACRKNDHFSIEKAIMPKPALAHSVASASSIASVIHQKYELAVPLYRQEKEWTKMGLELSRATMANWLIASYRYYLAPLVKCMKRQLLTEEVLHAGETTIQVLNEKERGNASKSYIWVYCSGNSEAKHNIRLFEYQPERKGEFAKEFLKGFKGYLIHDQYVSYLKDGRINFTNAIAENAIRPFAVGRKNWLFSASPKGASASAAIYSLIETCKANEVEPYRYFVYILQRMPNEPFQIQPELLEEYLPWCQAVQMHCK